MANTTKNSGKSVPSKSTNTGKRTINSRTYSNGGGYDKPAK